MSKVTTRNYVFVLTTLPQQHLDNRIVYALKRKAFIFLTALKYTSEQNAEEGKLKLLILSTLIYRDTISRKLTIAAKITSFLTFTISHSAGSVRV